MRRHSMYERDGPPRYRPHMPPQRYGPPLMGQGPVHRGPFMGGGHRDMYHPYNAPRPQYHRRDDLDKDFRDRRTSLDRRGSSAHDSPRNYGFERQDSRDGRRPSDMRRDSSPPPPLLRNPPDFDKSGDSNSNTGWDKDDRDALLPPPPPSEPTPAANEALLPPPGVNSPRAPPIPPPGLPPPMTPMTPMGSNDSSNSAILPTPTNLHPLGSLPLISSNSAPLLPSLPNSGVSSPLLGNAPPMASAHNNGGTGVGFQQMTSLTPGNQATMQPNVFNFTTPFRNKMRPGFSPQHSFPGGVLNANPAMYNQSPLGIRPSMPNTPVRGPMGMTLQQQQSMIMRQKFDMQIATDKKLTEHLAGIWAVEEKDRERDRKIAEDARRMREAESRASAESCRALGALQFSTLKVAVCDSRMATIRAQIDALRQ